MMALVRKVLPTLITAAVIGGGGLAYRLYEKGVLERRSLEERMVKIEANDAKWNALADHESRLRILEPKVEMHALVVVPFLQRLIWSAPLPEPNSGEGPAATGEEDVANTPVDPENFKEQWDPKGKR